MMLGLKRHRAIPLFAPFFKNDLVEIFTKAFSMSVNSLFGFVDPLPPENAVYHGSRR